MGRSEGRSQGLLVASCRRSGERRAKISSWSVEESKGRSQIEQDNIVKVFTL